MTALNSEGLEKAYKAAEQIDGEWISLQPNVVEHVIKAYLSALPPVDGLEVVMEKICHKEQIGIWANEITSALALSYFLRDEWTFDDSVDLEKEIAAQLRDIIKSAFTHPGLDLVASLSQASSVIAGLKEANEALMRERTSLIETKREQIERLTSERDEAWSARNENAKLKGQRDAALARISSLEEENKRLREALGSAYEHIERQSELLKIIKKHWVDYDHVFSIAVHESDEFLADRQALEDHNG
jgi:DNA repair exonuclease SbcCD ATPase subunit